MHFSSEEDLVPRRLHHHEMKRLLCVHAPWLQRPSACRERRRKWRCEAERDTVYMGHRQREGQTPGAVFCSPNAKRRRCEDSDIIINYNIVVQYINKTSQDPSDPRPEVQVRETPLRKIEDHVWIRPSVSAFLTAPDRILTVLRAFHGSACNVAAWWCCCSLGQKSPFLLVTIQRKMNTV